jgi:hypothetical protein
MHGGAVRVDVEKVKNVATKEVTEKIKVLASKKAVKMKMLVGGDPVSTAV